MFGTPRTRRRLAIATVALVVSSATACDSSDGTDSDVSPGDPSYAYQEIAIMHQASAGGLEPRNLADALPNRQIVLNSDQVGDVKDSFSDVVATGQITKVVPDIGIFYPNAASKTSDPAEGAKVVSFDNPDANERIAIVTLKVDWSAGAKLDPTVQFRIGVPANGDANKFLAGVLGIDEAVVLLKQFEEGRFKGDYFPILGTAGLGGVNDDGTLAFDGFGDGERDFTEHIDTLDQLKAEASKTETMVRYQVK